jgi:hypothetical protein
MRKFIDIISNGVSSTHNRIEMIFSKSSLFLLESFSNPSAELKIAYRVIYEDHNEGKVYIEAIVSETKNNEPVIKIDYTLGDKNLVISNIISFRDDKSMFTSSGPQSGAADMGYTAISWLFKNILTDAKNRGFENVKISSSTRYSGARAKNGQQTAIHDIPINYNAGQKITERFVYTLEDGMIFLEN